MGICSPQKLIRKLGICQQQTKETVGSDQMTKGYRNYMPLQRVMGNLAIVLYCWTKHSPLLLGPKITSQYAVLFKRTIGFYGWSFYRLPQLQNFSIQSQPSSTHQAISKNFWRYLEIIFRQYLVVILEIFVRFTLKELRWELSSSSSFNIISDSEKGVILFLQIAVMFKIQK